MENDKPKKVLILGGGASGQRAAVDLIEAGAEVILVEAEDTIGGTMLKLGTMFPKHNCLLCRGDEVHGNGCTRPGISQTLLDYSAPTGLDIRTRSRVVKVEEGINDTYEVTVVTKPRYVLPEKCILCGRCSEICPHSLPDPYQAELVERKAVYLPAERCVPESYAVEKGDYCTGCGKCQEICPTDAIDLSQETAAETVTADAVVLASGMQLYDPRLSAEYGYGSYSNVISGMQMERMVSPAGPGEGNPARGSDGKAPEKIAWLQCVGSRDEDHDFCSSYCCGYATRQAVLAKQLLPEADMRIFMMDDRVFGRNFSRTYDLLRKEYNIALEHCRISVLRQDDETKDLILQINGEDGTVREESFSMVVLSIGGTGSIAREEMKELFGIESDEHGFVRTDTFAPLDTSRPGIFAAGSVSGPSDLADSVTGGSAAAARACSYLGIEARRHREDDPRVSASGAGGKHGSGSPKIGIFVCNCGGEIGNTVNLDTLSGEISGKYVDGFEVIPYGCLPEGTGAIRSAIAANNLTHAVIGACKRRTYGPLFRRELPVPVEFVSLREECAYVHGSDPEGATRKALTLLRDKLGPIQAEPESAVDDIVQIYSPRAVLVIGGGLAGLTASLHLADAGAEVHLVEREEVLGGNALRLNRSPEGVAVPQLMEKTVEEVVNNPRISVYTRSEVKRQVSSRGVITASIRPAEGIESGGETAVTAGAVIITSGGEEYRGPVFGLDSFEKVMTLLDLGERQRSNPGLASSVKEVVFIGCAGPWCEPGSTQSWRCSRTCCETMVKQARYFREQNPACRVTVLVREVNTYSVKEEDYTAARKAGVLFVRYTPDDLPVYSENGEGPCLLVHDKHLGETLEFHPDMVVLAAAILPREDALRLSGSLEVPLDEDGFFKEWESKTRPYSTLEPVVSVAGLAHGPKPVREVITQSLAAAQNALANLNTKRLIDTRDVAKVSFGDCTSCLTCVRSCPYSVPRIGKEGYPRNGKKGRAFIDVFRCQGCGACVSECPAKAISLERFSDKVMLESGVLGGTSVTVISCRYCGNIPIELAGTGRHQYPADVKVVDVPCTGFITSRHILSALEQGAEGVLVHACPEGACHHLTGNKRAEKRLAYCRELLKAAGMNPDRVRFADLGIGHGEAFARLVTEFSRELRKAGEPREVHG
jgi:heterodisulfide reductase subunit A2